MKTRPIFGIIAIALISSILIFSCQKSSHQNQDENQQERTIFQAVINESGELMAGGVNLTAPTTVNINENFSILAEVTCGRISIERGYILGPGGVHIYKNLTCATSDLQWEAIVNFQCYTTDASWTGSLNEIGTYVYRTKHNGADGNCDGLGGNNQTGNCSFNGNEVYCFMIEAVDPCETSFTGEAVTCGNTRQAIYRFSSEEAMSYIKIQGGLTNFTGGDAVVTISGGNLTYTQFTPGGSSNRVIVIEGSVSACEEIIITVNWTSSNSGGIITGQWSAKDANGIDIAPPVAGLSCQ